MQKNNTRFIVYTAMLVAIDIILTRMFSISIGQLFRITFGKVPVMLAGLWMGPLAGATVGGLGDFLGFLLFPKDGETFNPIISSAAILTGILPCFFKRMIVRDVPKVYIKTEKTRYIRGFADVIAMSMFVNLITAQFITSYGLCLLYGQPYWVVFASRIPQSIVLGIVNAILVFILYASPVTGLVTRGAGEIADSAD